MSKESFKLPIWIMVLCFLAVSCQSKVKRPHAFIEKEDFAKILADLHLLEARYMTGKDIPDSLQTRYLEDYNLVFEIHGTNSEDFFKNFNYYRQDPEIMEECYELVNARLHIMEDQIILENEGIGQ